jgi:SAM-dependent methyltransferase
MFDRKAHWEGVYQDKSPLEVSWYQQVPSLSLELIQHAGIAADAPVIDVGGGASVLVDALLTAGYRRVAVLDLSAKALAAARERLGAAAAGVEWIEADITAFAPAHPFALWHDRAVFHFLTAAADRAAYRRVLKQTLPVGGHLIIAAFAVGGPTRCSGLEIVQYDAHRLGSELGEEFESVEQRSEVHITPAGKEQAFNYFRFIRRPSKAESEANP